MKKKALFFSTLFIAATASAQPGVGAGAGGGMPTNEVIMANNDGNGDGEITRAEADEAALALSQNWDMFDLDSDGKVVAGELDQARGQFGGGGGRAGGPGAGAAAAPPPPTNADDDDDDEESED